MSATYGKLREVHNPHASAAAAATPMAANTACAPVSHAVESVGLPPFAPSFSSTSAITPAISITRGGHTMNV